MKFVALTLALLLVVGPRAAFLQDAASKDCKARINELLPIEFCPFKLVSVEALQTDLQGLRDTAASMFTAAFGAVKTVFDEIEKENADDIRKLTDIVHKRMDFYKNTVFKLPECIESQLLSWDQMKSNLTETLTAAEPIMIALRNKAINVDDVMQSLAVYINEYVDSQAKLASQNIN